MKLLFNTLYCNKIVFLHNYIYISFGYQFENQLLKSFYDDTNVTKYDIYDKFTMKNVYTIRLIFIQMLVSLSSQIWVVQIGIEMPSLILSINSPVTIDSQCLLLESLKLMVM